MTERPKLYDASLLPTNKPRDEYHPDDCICDYGTQVKNALNNWEPKCYPTGSGHKIDCLSHERWESNGRSWRTLDNVKPFEFTQEAIEITAALDNSPKTLPTIPREFLKNIRAKIDQYQDRTFVSKHEISFLRQLKERYL